MTSAPTKPPVLKGMGDIDYLGLSEAFREAAGTAAPQTPTWASRVGRGSGSLQPSSLDMSQEAVDQTIEEMELRQLYDELTDEEWKAIHNPDDRAEYGYTLAEGLRMEELKAKWVKSIGSPVHKETRNGVSSETWVRGNLVIFEVTQPDGNQERWLCSTTRGLRYQLGEQGDVICTAYDNYQVAMRRTNDSHFVDCSISENLPQKTVPMHSYVNGKKGEVMAGIEPNGQIIYDKIRGKIKDHQFIAKTRHGAFVTIDSKGNPMLADLDKLPSHIPLTDQDRVNHQALAQQIASGERQITEFIRQETEQERRQGRPANASPDMAINHLRALSRLDKQGGLAKTPNDLEVTFQQLSPSQSAQVQRSR